MPNRYRTLLLPSRLSTGVSACVPTPPWPPKRPCRAVTSFGWNMSWRSMRYRMSSYRWPNMST